MFPEGDAVRSVQSELDPMIEEGVARLVSLLKNSDPRATVEAVDTEDTVTITHRQKSSTRERSKYRSTALASLKSFNLCQVAN